jgi:uroporphyrinogen decarboxylase
VELEIPLRITENLYEDVSWRISGNEIRLALGSEIVVTGTSVAREYRPAYHSDGRWKNEYGMTMRLGPLYKEVDEYPLAHAQTAQDIADFELPDLSLPGRFDDARELVRAYHDDFVVIGGMGVSVVSLVQQLVGMEKLMMDMALRVEYLPSLITKVVDFQIDQGTRLLECGVDGLFIGDDFGSQTSLLFSREMFLEYWASEYKRLCEAFRSRKPEVVLVLHSDGAITELLDDMRSIGFDVLNPLQPGVPRQSPDEMKANWGAKFAFWGGIDEQYMIPHASVQDLDEKIARTMRVLGEGGGFVVAPAHILQPDVSPERVRECIQACQRHSKIPD